MKIVRENKKSWKVKKYKPLGVIMAGYASTGSSMWRNYRVSKYDTKKSDWDTVENVIFEARILPTGMEKGQSSVIFQFDDADDNVFFEAGASAVEKILLAIACGDITVSDGLLVGTWTFRKQGTTISIWPCDKDGVEYKQ